jgi:tRNA pseudouridine13 synthase
MDMLAVGCVEPSVGGGNFSALPPAVRITKKMEPETKRLKTGSEDESDKGITERDVAITEYLSPELMGFRGILKQRYTDFLVNEVLPDGTVLHLTDLGLADKRDRRRERREQAREEGKTADDEAREKEKEKKVPEPTDEQRQQLAALLGEETYGQVVQLFSTGSKLITDKSYESKDDRTRLHQLIREAFGSRLETRTDPENKFVVTLATDPGKGVRRRGDKLDKSHMGRVQDYVHFVLYKENKETMEVANLLSKFLRIPPKTISYAGTKDRRGVTVQKLSVSKIKVERLNGLNKTLRGVKLGSFEYSSTPLKLGELAGNEFIITIREADLMGEATIDDKLEEVVNKAMDSLRTRGFINYYGMQRFGTFSISTHTVGKHVLNSDWRQVVDLILSEQELVLPESVEARKKWADTQDAQKTLELMPRKCVAEQAILKALAKDPTGYLNAVMQIPRNLRVMYAHAYQSYVWNCVASERIKRFGTSIVAGDLVIDDNAAGDPGAKSNSDDDELEEDLKEVQFTRARPVSQEEIDSNSKTIFDVVLPSPGFDVVYPGNELADVYKTIMSNDGIDHTNMKRNIKEFSLAGSYRYLISKPANVEWWVKKYDDPTDQLVKTDLDLLTEEKTYQERISQGIENGKKNAIVLKLQLGTSQYATMALREVMKVDTSRRGETCEVRKSKNSPK